MSHVNASESHKFNQSKQIKKTVDFNPTTSKATSETLKPQSAQTSELGRASQNAATLPQELQTARQHLDSQRSLVESLSQQLASSQARITHLETDLGCLQQRHAEQAQLLQEAETACLDLRARLLRQQRQTFQFKAALEKCLESSARQISLHPLQNYAPVAVTYPLAELKIPSPSKDTSSQAAHLGVDSNRPTFPAGDLLASSIRSGHNLQDGFYPGGTKLSTPSISQALQPEKGEAAATDLPATQPEEASSQTEHLPLVFKEQPIQPWSAGPSMVSNGTESMRQPIVEPSALLQAETSDLNRDRGQSGCQSFDLTSSSLQSSPTRLVQAARARIAADNSPSAAAATKLTVEPFRRPQFSGQRKSLAAVELPCFPRRQS